MFCLSHVNDRLTPNYLIMIVFMADYVVLKH